MTTKNKEVIRKLNKGFEQDEVDAILSCVSDDVHWYVPGAFTAHGKEEFRQQIHNENFVGTPTITIKNEVAEGDYVAVEGSVTSRFKDGNMFNAYFHNTYRLENEKVKEMTSYLVPKTSNNLK
jgi:ketosteroid isomerase-like protein